MAQTPEGKVKAKVSALLKSIPGVWYTMPVPSGFGESTLDYLGSNRGLFFAIETKAPGKKPTSRQMNTMAAIERGGGKTFVVDGDITELETWLRITTNAT